MTSRLVFAIVLSALVSAGPALAKSITLHATLTGDQGSPPNSSAARGTALFVYDDESRSLTYSLTIIDIQGPLNRIDIHGPGTTQSNAPSLVVLPTLADTGGNGAVTLPSEQGGALVAGRLYIDVHTDSYRDGEIRGQILR